MSRLAERVTELPFTDDLEAAVDEVLRLSGGDARTAVRAVLLGQRSIVESYSSLISTGYARTGTRPC